MIDQRLLQQFFVDPTTGKPAMMPPIGGGAPRGGPVGEYGVPTAQAFEMEEGAPQGVTPPPGYGRAPMTGDEGSYGPPPRMPAPPSGGPGSFMPMAAPGGTGGMQSGPYNGPPPSMQSGPYSGPPAEMANLPPAQHPTQVIGDLVNQYAEQRKQARGQPQQPGRQVRDPRALAEANPAMMDDEKRQRLIQAILRARGML